MTIASKVLKLFLQMVLEIVLFLPSPAILLAFVLLNSVQCGHKFHYGTIQLESADKGTKVTQVAYFDFVGASLWAHYPWGGGMVDFLTHFANWEQNLVVQLKHRYAGDSF